MKWLHCEIDPSSAFLNMQEVLDGKKWGSNRKREEHALRSMTLATMQAARCSTTPPPVGQYHVAEYGEYWPERYATKDDLYVASILGRTIMVLAPNVGTVADMFTLGDGPIEPFPAGSNQTSAPPVALLVAAVVVGGVALTISACQFISTAGTVIDNELTRNQDTVRLVELQKNAIVMELDHAKRSEAAGKILPYSDGEKTIIGVLKDQQDVVAKRKSTPIKPPFEGALDKLSEWGDKAADGVQTVAKGVSSGLEMAVPAVAIGFLALKG